MAKSYTIPAMSIPLASIFGSGFLVVVPILASAVGPDAVFAMIAVSLVAFLVGSIVRHNILCAEPAFILGSKRLTVGVERLICGTNAPRIGTTCPSSHLLAS
jgi:hypothetical protein